MRMRWRPSCCGCRGRRCSRGRAGGGEREIKKKMKIRISERELEFSHSLRRWFSKTNIVFSHSTSVLEELMS